LILKNRRKISGNVISGNVKRRQTHFRESKKDTLATCPGNVKRRQIHWQRQTSTRRKIQSTDSID